MDGKSRRDRVIERWKRFDDKDKEIEMRNGMCDLCSDLMVKCIQCGVVLCKVEIAGNTFICSANNVIIDKYSINTLREISRCRRCVADKKEKKSKDVTRNRGLVSEEGL